MKPVEHYHNREQTYLKHFFLERYLETVAYHIGFSYNEFVFVDCFSGPWRAEDEELSDTSIRIALDKLNAVRTGLVQVHKYPSIRAIFVEKSPVAFNSLQQVLEDHRGAIKTTALPGTFEENIDRILGHLGQTFGFVFVDPTGWTGFAMDRLRPILQRAKGEVMINFMYDHINRFLTFQNLANEESLDLCFGTPDWRSASNSPDRETALVDLYVDQVRLTGDFAYATSSRILKPLHDRAYYHLVYATRSPKGIEEFRSVERRFVNEQDTVREKTQRKYREAKTGQGELYFPVEGPTPGFQDERRGQLRKAEARMTALLAAGPIRYEMLVPRILELRLVWRADVNHMLVQWLRSGHVSIDGMGPRDRAPKPGCTIRLGTEKQIE